MDIPGGKMKHASLLAVGLGAGLLLDTAAFANEDVLKHTANPAEQVLQTVDYANTAIPSSTRSMPAM